MADALDHKGSNMNGMPWSGLVPHKALNESSQKTWQDLLNAPSDRWDLNSSWIT